ncbi:MULTISPECIES: DeoR/GlpR family DNA-binding transcription regulator [Lactobacillus]|jgi:lactose transport regulator|uniref:DeoR/GlpR family DNA-binding transcription regulator n=1 Tax=Lactobacillus TaxID=1578 RepID=UPI00142D7998|nr:DeoR/GlpR family DNA-binding transcription regulator [Lactobacillus mulieris]MCW8124292.1 DeoR/GlpR family DNA-binding transcription regulator [Lactobacillus mulieris]MCZ9599350.1 DeoR/GlpR family DNA-binding transcription regulator [Lactobacillus mulieris]MDK7327507.1 DeoR/GlpR family DNA-binding transcription regulator [Lactobacillus mulieris]
MSYLVLHKKERQEKIILLLAKSGFLTTKSLAQKIGVTEVTIRRDLTELAKKNEVQKTFGGAKPNEKHLNIEFSTQQKINVNVPLKKQIGKKLAEIIPNNSTIFLGAGTTLLYSIEYLLDKNISFITNSVPAFERLASTTSRVLSTGGELHKNTGEFLGLLAERTFDGLNIDYALCSTNGILDDNVTTSIDTEGALQNKAILHSKKTIIVADHTKLDRSDLITFRSLTNFDMLVTDNEIQPQLKNKYSKYTKIV